jgi:predicted adenine nucleotide alpha hydrolase (AANH) superfamily ATPase
MKMLLHLCCGPCACFPVKHLRDAGHDIVGYFYNPNIHPYKEFTRRLDTSRELPTRSASTLSSMRLTTSKTILPML